MNYKNWNIFNIAEMHITKPTRDFNSYQVRREYKHNRHFEEMYPYFYEKSRQIYKSVDRFIEKETLKDHLSCVTRFQEVLKEESGPFPLICPHAYAYILWKQSLLGYGNFYVYRMGANKANKYLESFELVNRFFTKENNYIFDQFLDNTYNFKLHTPWELLWLLERITATVCVSFFRVWQHIAVDGALIKLAPNLELLEKLVYDYMPFFVIKYQNDLTEKQPVTIFEYSTRSQRRPIRENSLVCPGERRIDDKVEKIHTPIAYSMRYFESKHPDNYQEEKNYINKYVQRLNAPIKYSKL